MDDFRKTPDDCMFMIFVSFQKEMHTPLGCQELENSHTLRVLCVFMHYGVLNVPVQSSVCKVPCTLEQGRNANELSWLCTEKRSLNQFKQHFFVPCLPKDRNNCRLVFLHFCVLILRNEKIKHTAENLNTANGTGKGSVSGWKRIQHDAVSKFVKKNFEQGRDNKERRAVDELAVGKVGSMVGKPT